MLIRNVKVNEIKKRADREDKLFYNLVRNTFLDIVAEVDHVKQVVMINYTLQDKRIKGLFNAYEFEMPLVDFRNFLNKCVAHNIYPLINATRYGMMPMFDLFKNKDIKTFVSYNHQQKNKTVEADNTIHFINLDGVANMTHDWFATPSLKHLTSYKFTYESGESFAIASKRTEGFVRGTYTNTNKRNYLALATDEIRAYHEFENDRFFERFQIEEILNGIFSLYMPSLQKFANQLVILKNLLNVRDPRA